MREMPARGVSAFALDCGLCLGLGLLAACGLRSPDPPAPASRGALTGPSREPESTASPEESTSTSASPLPSEDEVTNGRPRCGIAHPRPAELASIEGANGLIWFPKEKDDGISRDGLAELDRIAAVLREYPDICVEIVGHVVKAPGASAFEYGKDLSLRRANRVRALLQERGVADWRLMTRGAGDDQPIETNTTREGRRKNERIDFMIISPAI